MAMLRVAEEAGRRIQERMQRCLLTWVSHLGAGKVDALSRADEAALQRCTVTAGRTRESGVFDARVTTTAGEGVLPTRTAVVVILDRLIRSSEQDPIAGDQPRRSSTWRSRPYVMSHSSCAREGGRAAHGERWSTCKRRTRLTSGAGHACHAVGAGSAGQSVTM